MNTVAIVQARMSSTRLPGKVLLPMGNDCALGYVFSRLSRSKYLDHIIIATTSDAPEEAIVHYCESNEIPYTRGDAANVLSRYFKAAVESHADTVVRITSDCPFVDYELLDAMLERFSSSEQVDYLSNVHPRSFPKGLDIEIFTRQVLEEAMQHAKTDYEKEHVTPYIYTKSECRKSNYQNDVDLSAYRWTLDTPEDYRFLKQAAANFSDPFFRTGDLLSVLDEAADLHALMPLQVE